MYEDIKTLKELLDSGALTQKEYEKKKLEILGLESEEEKAIREEREAAMAQRKKKAEEEELERKRKAAEEKAQRHQKIKAWVKKYGRIGGIVLAAICLICVIGIGCTALNTKDSMEIEDVNTVFSSSRETVLNTFPKAKTSTAHETVVVKGLCGGINGEYSIYFDYKDEADRVIFRWDEDKVAVYEKDMVNELSEYLGGSPYFDPEWESYEWENSMGMDVEFWPDEGIWFDPENL